MSVPPANVPELLEQVKTWARVIQPHTPLKEVVLRWHGGHVWRFVLPWEPGSAAPAPQADGPHEEAGPPRPPSAAGFVPTQLQREILAALNGQALRTDELLAAVDCPRSQLFKRPTGGLQELRDRGLVAHHDNLGYYRVDSPPPEIEEDEQTDC
jgi:hypothetical protein